MLAQGTMKSEWNFDETIKLTMKGVPVELDLDDMSDDDEEWELRDKEVNIEAGSAWGTTRVRESGVGSTINVSDSCASHGADASPPRSRFLCLSQEALIRLL